LPSGCASKNFPYLLCLPEQVCQPDFSNRNPFSVSTGELSALWRAISEASRGPAIRLKLGTDTRIERYESGGFAALCSQSFGDALQRMARYKQIDLSGRDPDHPAPATRPPSSLTGCWRAIPVSAGFLELRFSWILSICRRGVGTPISPLRLKLACSGTHRELIEVHFDCRGKVQG
jgi:Arabinose-binding domain of AraC transcription regulator, N-term